MKKVSFLIAVLLASSLSCSRDTIVTVSSAYDGEALVAEDRDTMERLIDCAITRNCDHLSVMGLLAERKAFLVETGTKVIVSNGLAFSMARKIRILEGEHSGKEGWVYERALRSDRSFGRHQPNSRWQTAGRSKNFLIAMAIYMCNHDYSSVLLPSARKFA
jgi:hypothetical protein